MNDFDKNEIKFTSEQKESLINFVKRNKTLYVNSRDNTKRDVRAHLWRKIGRIINKSPDVCRRKWIYLRDRFVKNLKRTNPSKLRSRDDKLLTFLLDVYPELQAKADQSKTSCDGDELTNSSDASSMDVYHRLNSIGIDAANFVDIQPFAAPSDNEMKNPPTNFNQGLTPDLCGERKSHSPTAPMWSAQPLTALDKFLLSLGATISSFPEVEIAKLKLELSNIVFNKELELAEAKKTK